MPELDTMWHKLANNPQVLQHMFSLPYTKTVLEGLEASPTLAQQVRVAGCWSYIVNCNDIVVVVAVISVTLCPKAFIFCCCPFWHADTTLPDGQVTPVNLYPTFGPTLKSSFRPPYP